MKKRQNAAISLASIIKNTFILFILFTLRWPGISQANLIVTPTKVAFEGRTHSQELILLHQGDREATYRISFIHYRMKQDGSLEEIKEPKPNEQITFVDEFIRYSPRQVTLKPGEKQTVRLMVRKPKDLAPGEYRSHLLFKEETPPDLGADIEKGAKGVDDKGIGIKLIPLFAVSIPVVVRHGDVSAKIEIQEAKIIGGEGTQGDAVPKASIAVPKESIEREGKEGKSDNKKAADKLSPKLSIKLKRSGNASISGDVAVTFIPAGGSEEYEVGRTPGIAVYCPNDFRDLSIPLKAPEGISIKNGKLHITFNKRKSEGGAFLAENTLIVP